MKCRAYGRETRNYWKLIEDNRQRKDKEGRLLKQLNRKILKKNYPYYIFAYKRVNKGVITQVIKINNSIYNYIVIPNPLSLLKYKNRWPQYIKTIAEALNYQAANVSVEEVRRLLSANNLLPISSCNYWNIKEQVR